MWERNKKAFYDAGQTGLMIDWSGMGVTEGSIQACREKLAEAIRQMEDLERGGIANPSEGRMVGHYWLRAPEKAPTPEIRQEIQDCQRAVEQFVSAVHGGQITNQGGTPFSHVMVAGIGGSSLGPVFVYQALAQQPKLDLFFLDNTDPAGMDTVFHKVQGELDATLMVVISKSGGTVETRNCMEEARVFYESQGLSFAKHAVCVSGRDSKLDQVAQKEGWLARFPMWGWVGGRTSVLSAVGLLPLGLAGVDTRALLQGAAACDALTRNPSPLENPAAILAQCWYCRSGGQGGETMVVLPYQDSLGLFAKYLQQLVMESLGKETDLEGNIVHQGLAVMGNKGSSDQHSYVQQLVAGPDHIFVTFLQVLRDREGPSPVVGEESTSGDYLQAFLMGTKKALEAHGKPTMTITIPQVDAYQVGQLIALFERAVGLYANLIHINAYDQPAVEWGKKAAGSLIALKNQARALLISREGQRLTAEEMGEALGADPADLFPLLLHLSANDAKVNCNRADPVWESTFGAAK